MTAVSTVTAPAQVLDDAEAASILLSVSPATTLVAAVASAPDGTMAATAVATVANGVAPSVAVKPEAAATVDPSGDVDMGAGGLPQPVAGAGVAPPPVPPPTTTPAGGSVGTTAPQRMKWPTPAENYASMGPVRQPRRARAWSLESLETLSDLCAREMPLEENDDDGEELDPRLDPELQAGLRGIRDLRFGRLEDSDDDISMTSSTSHNTRRTASRAERRSARRRSSSTSSASKPPIAAKVPKHKMSPSALAAGLSPHMSAIYNKEGRVGIYTPEERLAIIKRFHAKRSRRVWRKKIRYSCRKNLADRRIRVKGRFVKAGSLEEKVAKARLAAEQEGVAAAVLSSGLGAGTGPVRLSMPGMQPPQGMGPGSGPLSTVLEEGADVAMAAARATARRVSRRRPRSVSLPDM